MSESDIDPKGGRNCYYLRMKIQGVFPLKSGTYCGFAKRENLA